MFPAHQEFPAARPRYRRLAASYFASLGNALKKIEGAPSAAPLGAPDRARMIPSLDDNIGE